MEVVSSIKWPGGKYYLRKEIVSLMPPSGTGYIHYVEPYFGSGAVLFENDPEGISEVVNDVNKNLMNFWTVLQNPELFEKLRRMLEATPFSEDEFLYAGMGLEHDGGEDTYNSNGGISLVKAAWFFIRCRQSLAGRMKNFASISRNRTRRGMNEQASAWITAVEGLPAVHERLKRVVVLNHDAIDVIRQQDGEKTLFYLDPPYMHSTRTTTEEYGSYEMSGEDHIKLLDTIKQCRGKVMISGYHCPLYDAELGSWTCHEFELPNNAAGGEEKRRMVECIWCNY